MQRLVFQNTLLALTQIPLCNCDSIPILSLTGQVRKEKSRAMGRDGWEWMAEV